MKKRYYVSDMVYYSSLLSSNRVPRKIDLFAVELDKIDGVSNIKNIYLNKGTMGSEVELCFDIEESQLEKITEIARKVGYYSKPIERTLEEEKRNQARQEFERMKADEYRRIGIVCGLIKL